MSLPDILFFMSDQHTPYYSGFYGNNVDTPNLDRLCEDGIQFMECYTPCPLCVPARVSMLSALRSARTGIFTLEDALPDLTPTFLHYLVEQGYETVLAGRMHFVGQDQRHGFTRRIAGDMTTISWNSPKERLADVRGVYQKHFGEAHCTELVGGGESPVDYYDAYVVAEALRYLEQEHQKPQFLVVSLYGPHFPYVGTEALFEKYRKRVSLPDSFYDPAPSRVISRHQQDVSEETALGAQAAYCAMVERMDQRLGLVREAFDVFCGRRGNRSLFFYTSDHGDQCGDRRMFGKSTLFEKSVKVPLIFAGDGVARGVRERTPVSLMDLGPTVLAYTGAKPMPDVDGVSLLEAFYKKPVPEHVVYAEFLERESMESDPDSYCFMVRDQNYKYMMFANDPLAELLFDTKKDPGERENLIGRDEKLDDRMRCLAGEYGQADQAVKLQRTHSRNNRLWKAYENAVGAECDKERWEDNPPEARKEPVKVFL